MIIYCIHGLLSLFSDRPTEESVKSFQWYKRTYPNNVSSSGLLTCCECGSRVLASRRLIDRPYKLHYCSICGRELYYSYCNDDTET